jgi:hypothetical protein
MRGEAEKWVLPIVEKYMDNEQVDGDNAMLIEQWDLFKQKLKQVFLLF